MQAPDYNHQIRGNLVHRKLQVIAIWKLERSSKAFMVVVGNA